MYASSWIEFEERKSSERAFTKPWSVQVPKVAVLSLSRLALAREMVNAAQLKRLSASLAMLLAHYWLSIYFTEEMQKTIKTDYGDMSSKNSSLSRMASVQRELSTDVKTTCSFAESTFHQNMKYKTEIPKVDVGKDRTYEFDKTFTWIKKSKSKETKFWLVSRVRRALHCIRSQVCAAGTLNRCKTCLLLF